MTTKPGIELSIKTILSGLKNILGHDNIIALKKFNRLIILEKDNNLSNYIPTIAVNYQGDIIVSRKFWNKYVKDETTLEFILYHELLHHVLADTVELKNINPEDQEADIKMFALNVAMDCRINAWLTQFIFKNNSIPEKFLERLYKKLEKDTEIYGLLRPNSALSQAKDTKLKELYLQLYDTIKNNEFPSYTEIYELVLESLRAKGKQSSSSKIKIFIGTHGPEGENGTLSEKQLKDATIVTINDNGTVESKDKLPEEIKSALKEAVLKVKTGAGRSSIDRTLTDVILEAIHQTDNRLDKDILGKLAFSNTFYNIKSAASKREARWAESPRIPLYPWAKSDFIMAALDLEPILWKTMKYTNVFIPELLPIYLDVSGSTTEHLPEIIYLIANIDKSLEFIYGFSTMVATHTISDLKEGRIKTTGGTDFNCIIKHAEEHQYRRIIVITDGDAGCDHDERLPYIDEVITILFGRYKREDNYFSNCYNCTKNIEELIV